MYVLNPEHAAGPSRRAISTSTTWTFYTLTTTCCQIDLLELFHGGFSTGHGVLREPNDIASYSALACIAIQSNQNDQHGGQSIVELRLRHGPGRREDLPQALSATTWPGRWSCWAAWRIPRMMAARHRGRAGRREGAAPRAGRRRSTTARRKRWRSSCPTAARGRV